MKRHIPILLLLLAVCLTVQTGCGKSENPSRNAPETIHQETAGESQTQIPNSQPLETEPNQDEAAALDYGPNLWTGTYITADPNMEADPEVLDSVTMTLPEGITRHRVSNCQIDFVRNGTQVGGFLLVDLPEDMLQKAAETKEDFLTLGDHLGKQIMADVYPSELSVCGGGHLKNRDYYLAVFFKQRKGTAYGTSTGIVSILGKRIVMIFGSMNPTGGEVA